ncbi:putative amidophosphoribosyltransferase purF [Mycobacterium xenopi 4042]|uniref:Putative amidophosphoribosyltransferase purF n=1 Tax=Mycobacterium xenopi 4042 TaxID=1299334 RepID=X7ZXE8_MYCXE|nr:putative amidophosphoribosyltransferase purF [Mycobacterium xenopi 4042]
MIAATEQSASRLCTACFDGAYPIELSSESVLGKNVIEHMLATAARGPCRPTLRSTRLLWLKTRYGALARRER